MNKDLFKTQSLTTVLVMFIITVMELSDEKQYFPESVDFAHISIQQFTVKSKGALKTVQEAGVDAEAMEECGLLDCFSWLAQSGFLQNTGPLVQECYHSQWTRPLPSIPN